MDPMDYEVLGVSKQEMEAYHKVQNAKEKHYYDQETKLIESTKQKEKEPEKEKAPESGIEKLFKVMLFTHMIKSMLDSDDEGEKQSKDGGKEKEPKESQRESLKRPREDEDDEVEEPPKKVIKGPLLTKEDEAFVLEQVVAVVEAFLRQCSVENETDQFLACKDRIYVATLPFFEGSKHGPPPHIPNRAALACFADAYKTKADWNKFLSVNMSTTDAQNRLEDVLPDFKEWVARVLGYFVRERQWDALQLLLQVINSFDNTLNDLSYFRAFTKVVANEVPANLANETRGFKIVAYCLFHKTTTARITTQLIPLHSNNQHSDKILDVDLDPLHGELDSGDYDSLFQITPPEADEAPTFEAFLQYLK